MQPKNIAKSASVVGFFVFLSRLFGLVREQVFAALFGAGKYLDSFLAAFQIPNLLRDLFAEGALSTAFTTTFAKTFDKEGAAPAWRLASMLLTALILVMGGICVVGILASPLLVHVTNFGFHQVPGKFELTVELTRILFPFILMVSLAAVVMGILNSRSVFGLPASASSVFNVVSVVAGVALAYAFEPQSDWLHPQFTGRALHGLSLGVLLGGMAQLGIQLPALWKQGYRFEWNLNFKDARLRQVWALAWPSMIAGAAVQVNVLVNGMFASEIDGARSWLNCAFRLMQFPIGVFGVAIATVTLPAVARHHGKSDLAAVGHTVEESLRLAFFLTIPATVGLMVLAPEIIGVVYQHGRFSALDTEQTAMALRAYAIGLSGYAAIKVIVPCFYALDRPKTPLMVSLAGIGVNLILSVVLVKAFGMGHVGLAVTTGLLAVINFVQLAVYLRRDVGFGGISAWAGFAAKVGAGALMCGAAAFAAARGINSLGGGFLWSLTAVLCGVGAGAGAYMIAARLLRISEASRIFEGAGRLLRRFKR